MKYDPLEPPDSAAWLEADEDERMDACARFHRQFKGAHPRPESQSAHDTFHVIVENQLAMGQPPAVRAALERLLEDGLDRHEALHAIGNRLAMLMWEAMNEKMKSFPVEEYAARLDALTVERWRREQGSDGEPQDDDGSYDHIFGGDDDAGFVDAKDDLAAEQETFRHDSPKVASNDRCPCGSGKKYKKCCQSRG